ncbi:MAG: hypothetical protein JXA91_08460 [Candidatus Thermoplasmatota archaeon]|nr:hypothetical protein [Candidatus Thermoplasmatota archaeon]
MSYKKISKIFNDKGILSPRGKPFTDTIVFSIYKKGKIREERINRKDKVDVSDVIITVLNSKINK